MRRKENGFSSSFSVRIYFLIFSLLGIYALFSLNLHLLPQNKKTQFEISFSWPGASPENIETYGVAPLENMFSIIKGVQEISSLSKVSLGSVNVLFNKDANQDFARFQLSTAIRNLSDKFPPKMSYPEVNILSGQESAALIYTLSSTKSTSSTKEYIENYLKPALQDIKGLKHIKLSGANTFITEVVLMPNRLKQFNLTVKDVYSRLSAYYSENFIGEISIKKNDSVTFHISANLKTRRVSLGYVPLCKKNSSIIYLKDIAKVHSVERKNTSYFRVNGKQTITLAIYAKQGENMLVFTNRIKEQINKLHLPNDIEALTSYDVSVFLKSELHLILIRSVVSLLVLLLFVLLVHRKFYFVKVVFFSILANILLSVLLYVVFNIEINIYSLAGVAISMGMVTDNIVLMAEDFLMKQNRKVFPAILASSLTTIAVLSLSVLYKGQSADGIFQLSTIISVNLTVSLLVAMFLVPALMPNSVRTEQGANRNRGVSYKIFQSFVIAKYSNFLRFIIKRKYWLIPILILSFGLPVHKLPSSMKGNSIFSVFYNKTLGSNWYNINAKRPVQNWIGGALRLFDKKIFENSFLTEPKRTVLNIHAKMPNGAVSYQINEVITEIEKGISQFKEIEMFNTSISRDAEAKIRIFFKPKYENGNFPDFFKGLIVKRALNFGNIEWKITGVGNSFSNSKNAPVRSAVIFLYGYNYQQLNSYATLLKEKLEADTDATKIWIGGNLRQIFRGGDRREYFLQPQFFFAKQENLNIDFIAQTIADMDDQSLPEFSFFSKNSLINIQIKKSEAENYSRYDFLNHPIIFNDTAVNLPAIFNISEHIVPEEIYKWNQQYQLIVGFNHILRGGLLNKYVNRLTVSLNEQMPLGFRAESKLEYNFGANDFKLIYLLLVGVLIVYIISSIVFESLKQPLGVIAMIPIAFIGIFLTFSIFSINFDQGGYAAFLLITGISVNSSIIIINKYNNISKENITNLSRYIHAVKSKLFVISVTVLSTILGLLPFLVSSKVEVFWLAFSAGTIGGLVFSTAGIFLLLPAFIIKKRDC